MANPLINATCVVHEKEEFKVWCDDCQHVLAALSSIKLNNLVEDVELLRAKLDIIITWLQSSRELEEIKKHGKEVIGHEYGTK